MRRGILAPLQIGLAHFALLDLFRSLVRALAQAQTNTIPHNFPLIPTPRTGVGQNVFRCVRPNEAATQQRQAKCVSRWLYGVSATAAVTNEQ